MDVLMAKRFKLKLEPYRHPVHYVDVQKIEDACYSPGWRWKESDFLWADSKNLHSDLCGLVGSYKNEVRGSLFFRFETDRRVAIFSLTTHPDCRYHGIARAMLEHLSDGFDRPRMVMLVSEYNDHGIAFWNHLGFRAVGVIENYWPGHAAYQFEGQICRP